MAPSIVTSTSDLPTFKETMCEYRAELRKLAEHVMETMDDNQIDISLFSRKCRLHLIPRRCMPIRGR
jgi:isopenicillin N synthase-like dioxygenase